jgi:hypothetical protein
MGNVLVERDVKNILKKINRINLTIAGNFDKGESPTAKKRGDSRNKVRVKGCKK